MSTNADKSRGSETAWRFTTTSGRGGELTGYAGGRAVVGTAFPPDDELATLTMSVEIEDGWLLEIPLVPHGENELRIGRFSLVPSDGPVEIADPRGFKRLRLSGLQQRIERELPLVLGWGMMPSNVKTPTVITPKPGRGGYSDVQVAVWARDYVDAVHQHPSRPVAALVEANPGTTAAAWRRWLSLAKERRLLTGRPKATEGRAGGELTDRAKGILADAGMPTTTIEGDES